MKKNYLNNKDILLEIHRSKNSFSSYSQPNYHQFDLILYSVEEINHNNIIEAKKAHAKRKSIEAYEQAKELNSKVKQAEFEIPYSKITNDQLIFRVMTYDHIPDEPGRKKNPKTIADTKTKLNFPPFQHWKFNDSNQLVCVGKSHWKNDVHTGNFCLTHGIATDKLALMWLKLCDRYATRGNVRGYTYNDEMKGQAILQLTQIGLQFDESKSANPFAYYTAAVTNSFVRVINLEKRNQNIRDDILEMNNMNPSYTRQAQDEWVVSLKREANSKNY